MPKVVGISDSLVLFNEDERGVVIDKSFNIVVETGRVDHLISSRRWETTNEVFSASITDLAAGALTSLDIKIVASAGRLYTIPKGVQAEAKKALEWRKEHDRGGTPVGLNTAYTLAKGGQIGLQKVRHIAKYFPRHEIDKKAEGWEPGEKGFPSRGRIAWALWGGDSGWRWAQAIVERENKKGLTSDGYASPSYEPDFNDYRTENGYGSDVDSFKEAYELEPMKGPEFVARVRLDGSGIDRLYKIDMNGNVYVWDGSGWDDLGNIENDIYTYDKSLDGPYDMVHKEHIAIDPESAIVISAIMQQKPLAPIHINEIDAVEAQMFNEAVGEIDWQAVDYVITAAGDTSGGGTGAGGTGEPAADGQYTPEERSKNAARQVRDGNGKFAAQGSRVVIGGDLQNGIGYIRAINPDTQSVSVLLDSGNLVDVPANTTEKASNFLPSMAYDTADVPPLDVSGILGEPRVPVDRPTAKIPGTLPALTSTELQKVLYSWPAWVKEQRDAFKPLDTGASTPAGTTPGANLKAPTGTTPTSSPSNPVSTSDVTPDAKTPFQSKKITISDNMLNFMKSVGAKITLDAYKDPDLKDWLNKSVKDKKTGEVSHPNRLWYQPVTSNLREITAAGENTEKDVELTPDTSDVTPLFVALVSPDDPRAVLELVAIVPAGTKRTSAVTFKRSNKNWVKDEGILADLNSATPPPVVPLDGETYYNVLEQVDGGLVEQDNATPPTEAPKVASAGVNHLLMVLWGPNEDMMNYALVAAGGADRNRGNAERLRRYWTIGKGGMKIRWGTGGDWTRCVRHLSKYMGPRSKGYCALRHHEMTGMWTGDKRHAQLYGRKGRNVFSTEVVNSMEKVIEIASLHARSNDARIRMQMTASGEWVETGAKFTIPLVIPEGLESGDGRKFEKGAIELRELPLPLMWQIKTADGHMGSVVVGRIDHMERTDEGIGNATGVFDSGEFGKEAERLVREGFIRGVSADMDKFEAKEESAETENGAEDKVTNGKLNITQARVMGVTIVPKPAFQECRIFLVEENNEQEDNVIPDGVYVEEVDPVEAAALVACGFVAGAIPVVPPNEWFENPKLEKATPLTITDEGHVFGHIAAWHVDHIGMAFGTRAPRSKSKYAYFHTGVVRTDAGADVPVGQLTLAGGHAPLEASAVDAARHYDDTASAIADVHAGEDAHGIWVAGALRPGTTPEQIRALRASAPSGDWRPIKGSLELVAVCQVNVPGFPIARARVASGQVMALVAAGAQTLARMKGDPVAELAARVAKLEQLELAELSAKAEDARSKFAPIIEAKKAELTARMTELSSRVKITEEFDDSFGYISRESRQKLAKKGLALPDGSYPITSVDSLKDSIQAYGRSKPGKRAAVRRHIMKRARQLDKADLIPQEWKSMSSEEIGFSIEELRSRIPSITASAEAVVEPAEKVRWSDLGKASAAEFGEVTKVQAGKYLPGVTQPRDDKGKFRQVLARIKQDLGDSGLQDVVDKIEETEKLDSAGNYLEAARSAVDLIGIVDRIDSGALNPEALTNVRESARQLGEVIANLPLPFGKDAEKVRFSDLPPALKDLVKDMITRVEDKIGQEDADVATKGLRDYMAGGDYFNQGQVSSEMSKLLRLLT